MQTKQEFIEAFNLKEGDYVELENGYLSVLKPFMGEVSDHGKHWKVLLITGFYQGAAYPTKTIDEEGYVDGFRHSRPIPKPRFVPWDFEDIKKNADKWYYRGDSNSSHRIIELEFDLEEVGIGQESYLLDDFLDAFVLHDLATGDKQELKKEVTDV